MTEAKSKSLNKRCIVVLSFVLLSQLFLGCYRPACAQEGMQAANTQTIVMEVVAEPGCPVEITAARTELGFDSFGLPVFGKTYIDYKNGGEKAINAVKFRVRYLDKAGNSRGTFHANDEALVPQGLAASGKFAHYKLRANIQQAKIRVLAIKFSDGSTWESVRMKELLKAQQEGREVEADDEATDKPAANPVISPAAPAQLEKTTVIEPVIAPAAPAEPVAPAAEPAPVSEPLSATQQVQQVPSQPAPSPAAEPAKSNAPLEEEPLSATPQAMPLKKGGDPFSGQ